MDLTPGPAEDQKLSEAYEKAYDAIAAYPKCSANNVPCPECAAKLAVDAIWPLAYQSGWEDAAKATEDFRLGASDFGEVFLEHAVKGCFWEVQIGGTDNGSPRMELDSVLEAAREHIRTGHNTERGNE